MRVRNKMRKKRYYYPFEERKRSRTITYTFFGIFAFVLLFFPFFALNLRYQVGSIFSKIFDVIGLICLTFGALMTIFSIISLFTARSINTKYFIMGIVLIWVGCWCSGTVLDIFGFTFGDSSTQGQSGYY